MITVCSVKDVINSVENILDTRNVRIISVDGVDGSGKSYLANALSQPSKYSYVDIDGEYLISNNGKFIEFVNYEKLKSDIDNYLSSGSIAVVDCICITKVLNNIDLNADVKIYVKKIMAGEWRDGKQFDYSRNIEDVLCEKRQLAQEDENDEAIIEGREPKILNFSEENMKDEIVRYHFQYQPENNADIILERKKTIY
jgi:cytidylate kinase